MLPGFCTVSRMYMNSAQMKDSNTYQTILPMICIRRFAMVCGHLKALSLVTRILQPCKCA